MLADFEGSRNLNPDPRWNGSFAGDKDKSDLAVATINRKEVTPPRFNPTTAQQPMGSSGRRRREELLWGTAWFTYFQSNMGPVDLSEYTGLVLWARADVKDGQPVPTSGRAAGLRFGRSRCRQPNYLCDMNDNTVGGKGASTTTR